VPAASLPSVELTTRRLLLRRFTSGDGPALHAYLCRPEAVEFEPYDAITPDQAVDWARQRAADPAFWAICLRESGTLIGNLYLARVEPEAWRTWELGYVLHPDHWGRGYASEAAARLLDECFGTWGAHRVTASCDVANAASWRLLERLGFRREGHVLAGSSFHQDTEGRPIWKDDYLYAVLDDEWRAPPTRTP
jgi:[ribosomal protein S5]-alanine N-acetyltransferase